MSGHFRQHAWLTLMLAGLSCGLPRTQYYTMELPHRPPGSGPVIDSHLAIPRFRADRILMDDRIVYREGPQQVNFYEYHRWASPPADLVTGYFIHRLKDSGTYARVSAYNEGGRSDFTLRGYLHHFEELDQGKEVTALVALEIELLDSRTRAPVWREEAESRRPLHSRDVAGLVRAIYECLDEIASKLLAAMQKQVEQQKSRQSP